MENCSVSSGIVKVKKKKRKRKSEIQNEASQLLRRKCRDKGYSYTAAIDYAVRHCGMSRKNAAEAARKAYGVPLSGVQIVQGGLFRPR